MEADLLVILAGRMLGESGHRWNPATVVLTPMVPDGSSRRFYQLRRGKDSGVVAILPPADDPRGLAEAHAFFHIGRHLRTTGSPVPEIFAFDPDSGLVLCEDLGSHRLFEEVRARGVAASLPCYQEAVRQLARMQVRAAAGFDPRWCWDTPRYDRQLMVERESGYFLDACAGNLLGIGFDRQSVAADCAMLASRAAQAPADFFLHRDFQCRNLMLTDRQVRFIDFQGGRLGPLAYDLASLLLDPYAGLTGTIQAHLVEVYLAALNEEIEYDAQQFLCEYLHLALQRNLQIAGAFAFLSQVRGKPFFARYLQPALASLAGLLEKPEAAGYAALARLVHHCRQELAQRS